MVSDCTVWPIDDWSWCSMLTLKHSRHLNENGMKAVLKSTSFLLQMCINLRTALGLCLVISLYLKVSIGLAFHPFLMGNFKSTGKNTEEMHLHANLGVDKHKHKCVNTWANSLRTKFIFMPRHDPDNNAGVEIFQTRWSVT